MPKQVATTAMFGDPLPWLLRSVLETDALDYPALVHAAAWQGAQLLVLAPLIGTAALSRSHNST